MKSKMFSLAAMALFLCGCFTLHETPRTAVQIEALGEGKNLTLQLSGFEATVTSYTSVYGYGTVLSPGCGRRRHHLYSTTYATETLVPQVTTSTEYLDRATETFERCGYTLQTTNPAYRVEVKFSGPYSTDGDAMVSAAWTLLSIFSADYGVQNWTAKLKITDLATGKAVYFRDFSERYQVVVWGPLPLFSPAGSSKTGYNAMQSRCLGALTDRAVAEAVSFLSAKAK
jgi:hypothetical protein